MTLVLALRCRDGVVLASDGQATTAAVGQPTRAPVRKLFTLGGRIAWGAAGAVGMQQSLGEELARREEEILAAGDRRRALARAVIAIQRRALEEHVALPGARPPELACVFCWCDGPGDRASILSVSSTGADHQLHARHAAVGTGDIFAEYAMASIAHLGVERAGIEQAKVVARKAVGDAIGVAAAYLGPPVQMAVVTGAGGTRELSPEEVDGELALAVQAWEERQRACLVAPSTGTAVPTLSALMRSMRPHDRTSA